MSQETIGTIILLATFIVLILAGNQIIFSIGIATVVVERRIGGIKKLHFIFPCFQ